MLKEGEKKTHKKYVKNVYKDLFGRLQYICQWVSKEERETSTSMYGIDDEREVKNLLWNKFMNFLGFYVIFSHFFLLYSFPPRCCVFITKIIFLRLSCFSFSLDKKKTIACQQCMNKVAINISS